MNIELRNELIRLARVSRIVTYGEIAPRYGLDMALSQDRNTISRLLDEISESEFDESRPLLSAVVVHSNDGFPGGGFYQMAERLGLFDGTDRVAFFVEELRRVHLYWRNNINP